MDIFKRYVDLCAEKKDMERRIANVESEISKIESGDNVVVDTVACGKKGKKPLGTKRIEGVPKREYARKKLQLCAYKYQMQQFEDKIAGMQKDFEEFVQSIDDSRVRRIIRFKYVDGLTWRQTALRMGGPHTEESCRKAVKRYMKEMSDMSV